MSTLTDLIHYYDMLLDGAGGLPPERAKIIVNDLANSTPNGLDGYPQRFGIPDGLLRRTGGGQAGVDVLYRRRLDASVDRCDRLRSALHHGRPVAAARDDVTARDTMTRAVKTMFPDGRI